MRFEGKVAAVTGGGSGIGANVALALAEAGADVAVIDRNADCAQDIARRIREMGRKATACAVDVSNMAEVDSAFALIGAQLGGLHLAVNSAGIGGGDKSLIDLDEAQFDRVIAVNLKGVWTCLKAELRMMLQSGEGAVVNVASALGLIGLPNCTDYAAAKHGVVGLTKSAALEVAEKNIRVNAICPGIVRTPLVSHVVDTDAAAALAAIHPMNRFAEPSEIAQAILWLLSPHASFVTGTAMPVDGGWTTR
ncbi:glucose 1-dehydrogenase [Novosphingobium sp. FSY-8]|uniref:Glucose 1-dehydrogenase n=1 Tax=Novosphingobium ovatum TaxID=1908523 RepID=A0ABW9XFS7_9SPHN|nr:SDR family NAD(P)-dependent oxidoreductase [Novosphingobium ovatum]NBC37410.1 glucose 1-dehydrogenase [Novosphingobium ovatum]